LVGRFIKGRGLRKKMKKVGANYTPHKDITLGVYQGGKFTPYQSSQSYQANLDSGADANVVNLAEKGRVIHGSYKGGNFRPADIRGKAGYIDHIILSEGTFGFNYDGELVGKDGGVVGAVDKSGKMLSKGEYQDEIRRDVKATIKSWRSQGMPNLAETFEKLARVEAKLYGDIHDLAKRVGIDDKEIDVYAAGLSHFNKDVKARAEEEKRVADAWGGLERSLPGMMSVIALSCGVFFFSTKVTGNVVGLSNATSSWIGGILILIGLIAGFFWIKNKKKN